MAKCFVIQPFDEGDYDRRYKEVLVPAIKAAGLEPYRVDQDPSVTGIMESIEEGIEESSVCLADISINNPNVWYELGYARASGRQVVLLCEAVRRDAFPFDVKNLPIIKYATSAPSDFKSASSEITKQLMARLKTVTENDLEKVKRFVKIVDPSASVAPISRLEELEDEEFSGLIAVAEERDDPKHGISASSFRRKMTRAGFMDVAATLALESLVRKKMVERYEAHDYDGDPYTMIRATSTGMEWLIANREYLTLHVSDVKTGTAAAQEVEITDDDIPF